MRQPISKLTMTDNVFKISQLEEEILREHFPEESLYLSAVERLKCNEPLAYIIGEWYFYGETYKLNRDCLIPRPDTEHLVDYLINNLPKNSTFADLCTGSGCIAISVLVHRPDVKAIAVDISAGALDMVRLNAEINGVADKIKIIKGDVLNGHAIGDTLVEAIVSNPPYIRTDVIDILDENVKKEPRIALDGGCDGLDFYRVIYSRYRNNVKKGGFIVCEIGYDQGNAVKDLFGCTVTKDYSGHDRVAILHI